MADETEPEPPEEKKKGGKKGLIIGLLGALLLGGGSFYATFEGLILGPSAAASNHNTESGMPPLPEIAFIALDPMVISLGEAASAKFLRFTAQLDVDPKSVAAVAIVLPRIVDVLNTYLRAVSEDELGKPAALERLRAQMLRRIQVVTEQGQVKDLLITEFVLG